MRSGTNDVTALPHAMTTEVNSIHASVMFLSSRSLPVTATDATPGSASAPTGTVGFTNSGGTFSASSCTLGSASTNPTTGAVSTRCATSFNPNDIAIHSITASYSGDTTHAMSSGTTVVTALTHATTTGVNCMPASVPVGSATSCTATFTDAPPLPAIPTRRSSDLTNSGGTFSASSCTLGSASTNPTTGAVSTSCAVSFTPNAVAIHTIRSEEHTYELQSHHEVVCGLTPHKNETTTSSTCTPASVPVGSASRFTA